MRVQTANFNRPSPVLLSSSVAVKNGSTGVPDYTQLAYPFRKAIWVDEVRFDFFCDSTNMAVSAFGGTPQLGALVYSKLQIGRHYLMRSYVPTWLLGTAMSEFEEGSIDQTLSTPQAFSHYRWKLPEPLYVDAGDVLRTTFSRSESELNNIPIAITADITARVTYVGRVAPPSAQPPKVVNVPYVGRYVTQWGTSYQQSSENSLFNPFDKPILVQRMTGRVLNVASLLPPPKNEWIQNQAMTPSDGSARIQVQMFDSWGGKIVNDLTGPSDVWDNTRSAWTFDTVMPDKGQYDIRVFNIPSSRQLHVAFIGTRQEFL